MKQGSMYAGLLVALLAGVACARPGTARPPSGPPPVARILADTAERHTAALAEVRDALERYYAAFSARDWTRFTTHFWPGATLTTIWQPPGEPAARVVATTVPEFVRQAPMGPGSKPIFAERMTGVEIRLAGPLAQAWATYEAEFGEPGAIARWRGVDAFTLLKHEGVWRIVALAYAAEP